ncbi:MAG TPA: zf-HC2 domain-containing protein [Thermoanaerobaculia bacterium]|nr:zf-HC2 domain-containing protein [Thermoanaerobaculia bacterium]
MTALCERTRAALPEYLAESLGESDRRAVRNHVAVCAGCRAEAAAADPTLLFAFANPPEVSSAEVASVVESVRAGIALRQAERRIAPPAPSRPSRRGARAAAAAAVLLLALAISSGPPRSAPSAPAVKPVAAVSAGQRPEPGVSAVASPEGAPKASGGATVYDWNPGAGEPRVVWIVDGSLDI